MFPQMKSERSYMRAERKYPSLSFDSSQRQLNLFFTLASIFFRSTPLLTSIMVAKLSKISQKCKKMRAAKCNHYDHVVITMYTTHRHIHTDPHARFPIWQSNGLVLVQDIACYLAAIVPHCMNHRTLAGAFTTT